MCQLPSCASLIQLPPSHHILSTKAEGFGRVAYSRVMGSIAVHTRSLPGHSRNKRHS